MRFAVDRRRCPFLIATIMALSWVLTSCFSGGGSEALAQDCTKAKAAMEQARDDLTSAMQGMSPGSSGGLEAVASETKAVADDLRTAAAKIQDKDLKSGMNAAADDIEGLFNGSFPTGSADSGLAKLDKALQEKCSTG